MTQFEIYQGTPCSRCQGRERYVSSRNCVACNRQKSKRRYERSKESGQAQGSLYERGMIPDKPSRGPDWPTVVAADRTTIQADPIAVMAKVARR